MSFVWLGDTKYSNTFDTFVMASYDYSLGGSGTVSVHTRKDFYAFLLYHYIIPQRFSDLALVHKKSCWICGLSFVSVLWVEGGSYTFPRYPLTINIAY